MKARNTDTHRLPGETPTTNVSTGILALAAICIVSFMAIYFMIIRPSCQQERSVQSVDAVYQLDELAFPSEASRETAFARFDQYNYVMVRMYLPTGQIVYLLFQASPGWQHGICRTGFQNMWI